MKARVYVTLKPAVLDPAGKAVEHGLSSMGFEEVESVRLGKYIELNLADSDDRATAEDRIAQMCEKLLANTVIEDYRIEVAD